MLARSLRTRAAVAVCLGLVSLAPPAGARPEKIRPGHSYYSDELALPTASGKVQDIGAEKNYEEVYQFYTFYEAVYDQDERVVLFREYKRGEVIRTEEYRYDEAGILVERSISRPGKEREVTVFEAPASKSASEDSNE